ncbi:glycosyltransferase family 2 protein [Nocardioides albidus]|uniref:Glycosyltransferase family 2 protein n=1 Tax=Nocardioides albidus TaxID=1517589 RepID=A0A5C4W3J0_9ACTN|nr:glycosyltransferase family 2 protein [Nocardioides albidus]TNM42770.1 glycosyltransferase family 2 protein [Nocardioides albidus]
MKGEPPQRVLIIVPAWNEEASIGRTIGEIRSAVPQADVLVIDDGSRDRTVAEARRHGVLVCELPYNLGVGGAMRTGYRYAQRHGYDAAVQIDADGQHDPTYLAALLEHLDSADIIIGARFATKDDPYRVRGPRRWAMIMLAFVLSRVAGTRLTDVTSGFRVANRRAIAVFAAHYPAEYLGDTVESLVIASRAGCRVTQVPVTMRVRAAGQASQSPVKAAIYLARAMVALILALVRDWSAQGEFDQSLDKVAA